MSFYSQYIFPRLMDAALGSKPIQEIRKTVLSKVEGEVFEIGFGTGLNLPHYPSRVKRITTVDPNPGAFRIAWGRIYRSGIEVINLTLGGEKLPLENEKFDSVVCTFTLCSIQQVDKALQEMRRIL